MSVTALLFPKGIFPTAFNKEIDLLDDAIMVTLHTSSMTPDQDAWDYYNDVTNELSTANGYTAGGAAIANDTLTYTSGSNLYTYDGDDVAWTSSTLTARYACVYDSTPGTAATDPLLLYVNFGADVSSTAATFTITWSASGILTITSG